MIKSYEYTNTIIRAYQVVTKDTFNNGIISPLTWNQFSCTMGIAEIDESGKPKAEAKTLFVSLGLSAVPIDEAKYLEVKNLAECPDIMSKRSLDEILIQAHIFQEQSNFRMTVLESVIALEFSVYSVVKNLRKSKGMGKDKIEAMIFKLGLSQTVDSLKLFSNDLPSSETISFCKTAIAIRNKIVHEARLTVTHEEAQKALDGIESFVSHFRGQIEGTDSI